MPRLQVLGRLSGGVAHEINNLLGVVSNSMHLIQRHPAAAELQLPLAATLRAVQTGSQLTQHLLRLASPRPVSPQPLDLQRHLPELQALMRSLLGRRIDVSISVADDTEPVRVDASELDLALITLALDARDAMPSGGQLRLRACNAGSSLAADLSGTATRGFVLITASDDGPGSGRHLGAVDGFCTQAGGTARLDSGSGSGSGPGSGPGSGSGSGSMVWMWLPAGHRDGVAS